MRRRAGSPGTDLEKTQGGSNPRESRLGGNSGQGSSPDYGRLGHLGGPAGRKAGVPIPIDAPLRVEPTLPYVGRGGLKLAEALEAFTVSPAGLTCADIGASTGGFTDCLLQRGAVRVYAVDVDTSQLDDRLRRDPRVVPIEKNARNLRPSDFPERIALAVMDVSFISILKILPALDEIFTLGSPASSPILLSLIKPQFEAVRGEGPLLRGIVRDPKVHEEARDRHRPGRQGGAASGCPGSSVWRRAGRREIRSSLPGSIRACRRKGGRPGGWNLSRGTC